ncbi:hypothetical protein [Albibacillus kandeliae]|uniref:hypothetical protein n=1 Tax=Albibacillus kandeliae TaxID=2174228 RepID=UPI000D69FD82|nr:hypothetical protein [Albibacillus kandeliae]
MARLTATQLASELSLSKGRISQLVSSGVLNGCFVGEGRSRRFDLTACAKALNHRLDPGQQLGNGAETKRRVRQIEESSSDGEDNLPLRDSGELQPRDPDRYELARIQKVEEEARKLRRANAQDEGTLVLASEVHRQVARQIGQEVAEFETVLRDGARKVADRLGVDYRTVRQVLIETWREHRGDRLVKLQEEADQAEMTSEEQEADF